MMRSVLLVIFFTILFFGCKKRAVSYDHTFKLSSSRTSYAYEISSYSHGNGQEQVFYVLDPNDLMPLIKKILKDTPYSRKLIFIAIKYDGKNQRARDFTLQESVKGTGEGANFAHFITGELDSVLVSKQIISTNAPRGIIGHSLGGLFGAYCLSGYHWFFDDYLLMSPALFDARYHYFGYEADKRDTASLQTGNVFLGIGNAEDLGMRNGFEHYLSLLKAHYPKMRTGAQVSDGSHYKSREANLREGLKHLLP